MVHILSGYQTRFGEIWNSSLKNLIQESGFGAIKNSGIDKKDIDNVFIGNMAGGKYTGQEHLGALTTTSLGLSVPSVHCESACASGAVAFQQAYYKIKSGESRVALVVGAEKMTDVIGDEAVSILMGAGDSETESFIGLPFSGLYALMAKIHMNKFGTTSEQLANVSVINHKHGTNNKLAQFNTEITIRNVLESTMIADPLHLLDCSPLTDGAAAVILTSDDIAKEYDNPIKVKTCACFTDTLALYKRESLFKLKSAIKAGENVFKDSGLKTRDIDVLEVHDCFSINEILCLEALGFCKEGRGGRFVEDDEISLDGSIPTNTTGGLKSCGHPLGATGVRQILDVVNQIQGKSINQVKAKNGLCLNIGGSGATAVAHIFGVE